MSIVHTPRAGSRTVRTAAVLAAACSVVAAAETRAATKTFSATGTNWLDGPSWTPAGVPTATDDVLISAGTVAMTLNASPLTIQYITYSNASSRVLGSSTADATNSDLTLDGSGANPLINVTGAGTFTIRGTNGGTGTGVLSLVLNASGDFNVNTGGGLNISSVIGETGGARSITKTGAGALTFSGANTFSGDFTLGAGTVTITSLANAGIAQSLGTGAGTVALSGTLVYTGAATSTDRTFAISPGGVTISNANDITLTGTTTAAGAVTKTGAGALVLAGAMTGLTGAPSITVNGGTLRLDNTTDNNDRIGNTAGITLNNGALQFDGNIAAMTAEVAGTLSVTGGSNAVRTTAVDSGTTASISLASLSRTAGVVGFDLDAAVNVNFAAAPALSNGIIGAWATHNGMDWATIDGSNNVVAYAAYNTGDTPTWSASDNASLDVARTVAANAIVNTLRIDQGATLTVDPGVTLNVGNGIVAPTQALQPTISGAGSITAGTVAGHEMYVTVASATNNLTIATPIVNNAGGAMKLVKAGAGTLVIDGASTYTGDTDVLAGKLTFGATGSLAGSTVNVPTGGGTLDTSGQNPTIGGLTGAGATALTGGSLSVGANGSNTTYTGLISGTGALTKVGTGTLTLSGGVNTFTGGVNVGATNGVDAGGTLSINADPRLGATTNSVNIYNGTLRLADGTGVTSVITSGGPAGTIGVLLNINRPFTLNAGNGAVEVPTAQYGEIAGTISGSGALRKIGGGILDLRTATNTYSGGTIVEGGTLGINKDANVGAAGAPVEIRNGGTIRWYSSGAGPQAGLVGRVLTIGAGGGTVNWGLSSGVPNVNHQIESAAGNTLTKFGTNTVLANVAQPNMNGDLHLNQGRWNAQATGSAGNGTIYLNAPDISPATAAGVAQLGIGGTNLGLTVTLTNNIVLNPTGQGLVSFEVNQSTPTQNNLILNGDISGTGGLTKGRVANTGGILTLGGTNTYSGDTNILFGTIRTAGGVAIPDGSSVIMPNIVNVALDVNGTSETIGGLSGGGGTGGFVTLGAGILTINQAANTTYGGVISGAGGSIVKSGAGTLTLTRANTYSGNTTMAGGVLSVGDATHVGDAANTLVFDGGTLQATAAIPFARNVTVNAGGGTFDGGTFNSSVANVTGAGALSKTGTGTLTANQVKIGGALAVNGGTLAIPTNGTASGMVETTSLTVAGGAILAMNDNDFIVDYTGASPEFTLRDYVKAFADNPAATSGIDFTHGAGDVTIAVAEKTEWGFSTFNGVTLDDTTIVGKYTYYGDANLDGAVTSDDYVAVDVGLGTGDSWVQGDFNFSGSVTSDDYVAIDVNLGKGTPTPLAFAELKAEMVALHTAMFGDEYVQKLALADAEGYAALVPEPGALSLVALGAVGLLGRRRRAAP